MERERKEREIQGMEPPNDLLTVMPIEVVDLGLKNESVTYIDILQLHIACECLGY